MTIKMEKGDKKFVEACEKAGIPPTRRQWKKWQRKQGRAYQNRE